MLPIIMRNYLPDKPLTHAKCLGYLSLRFFALLVLVANAYHIFLGQFGLRMITPSAHSSCAANLRPVAITTGNVLWALMGPVATTGNHVSRIILGGSRHQMERVTTQRVVTLVAKHEAVSNVCNSQCVGKSVSTNSKPATPTVSVEQTITICFGSNPRPAFMPTALLDLCPKTTNIIRRV